MKLIGTRIRVETSKHKTEYFPEYCLESKSWFGKVKQTWYGVSTLSSHCFGAALIHVQLRKRTQQWAKAIIDEQVYRYSQLQKDNEHREIKETTYVKYP